MTGPVVPVVPVGPLHKKWQFTGGCCGCLGVVFLALFFGLAVGAIAWAAGLGAREFYFYNFATPIPLLWTLIVFIAVVLIALMVALSAPLGIRIQRFFERPNP